MQRMQVHETTHAPAGPSAGAHPNHAGGHAVSGGDHTRGAPSRVAIAGHPLHPMLIPFPIAFLLGAFAADLLAWWTGDPFWPRAALWLTGGGVVGGALAALFGLADFLTIARARERIIGRVHALGAGATLALATASWLLRLGDPAAAVLPWGLALSALTAGALFVTGWTGGDLPYRHLIGVTDHGPHGDHEGGHSG